MNTDKSEIGFSFDDDSILKPGCSMGVLNELSEKIIGCAYQVSNTLGCGFLEKVYENARKNGVLVLQQHAIHVLYDGVIVGDYFADILVENILVVEIKALSALHDSHKAQLLNYLKATGMRLGLLINFGRPKVEIRRAVL